MEKIKQEIKSIKIKISKGTATKSEVNRLVNNLEKRYKKEGKDIEHYIELIAFQEMKRRLHSSVYSEKANNLPKGYLNYCMYGELQNTKLVIKTLNKLLSMSKKFGDIRNPLFYGFEASKYSISWEFIVHIQFRHNPNFQALRNPLSVANGYNPTTFDELFSVPISLLFMCLKAIKDTDWIESKQNSNLLVHVKFAGQCHTIIRKGKSNEILSFYPRENGHNIKPIFLLRDKDDFIFRRTINEVVPETEPSKKVVEIENIVFKLQ